MAASLCPAVRAQAQPASAAPPTGVPPLYAVRLPGGFRWSYRLTRGSLAVTGSLRFAPQADRYELVLQGEAPVFGTIITQRSMGVLGPQGLVPASFSDRRWRRQEQVARFDRASGWVTFSSSPERVRWVAGMQDRLSWLVQLAGIAHADGERVAAGRTVALRVVGARGDSGVWTFRSDGLGPVEVDAGAVRAVKLVRLAREPQDSSVEVWLDPVRRHLPVYARWADGHDEPVELSLRRAG